ncbi:putative nuclease HARBI1 [Ischnura elegans]|uniref:putative nuclease HARBI1 n=1 Tax=Ischnura elegans TaxID=197161 RepID=UPI001ED8BBC4|nr:putative nuclease HARBI1 [Ischnura elegans]
MFLSFKVCDYDLKIIAVNAQHGGRAHDAHIWRASGLRQHLQECHQQGDRSSWLIGDSAYPLEPWFMTPFIGPHEGTPEARYNARFTRARACVERCFGVWKGWFRCLRRDPTLHYSPERAGVIINACAVLHNMALHYRVDLPEPHVEDQVNVVMDGAGVGEGNAVRRRLVPLHFT